MLVSSFDDVNVKGIDFFLFWFLRFPLFLFLYSKQPKTDVICGFS